jgi:hypothetical protein
MDLVDLNLIKETIEEARVGSQVGREKMLRIHW